LAKIPRVIRALNKTTGKETNASTIFSDTNWGTVTVQYQASIAKLKDMSYLAIVEQAQVFVKASVHGRSKASEDVADDDGTHNTDRSNRSFLVEPSDSGEECK
jgi:hypothetical protein